jgi:hypothetical protein
MDTDHEKIVSEFEYTDPEGGLLYQVVEYESGTRRERKKGLNGRTWTSQMNGTVRVPYKLHLIHQRPKAAVWICPSERDCKVLQEVGCVATTCCTGLFGWSIEHCKWLEDREVICSGEETPEGQRLIGAIFSTVHAYAKSVSRAEMPSIYKRYKNLSTYRSRCTSASEFAAWLGPLLQPSIPGLFYTHPKNATQEEIDSFRKSVDIVKSILPVTPKGRKAVYEILWKLTQQHHEKNTKEEIPIGSANLI